MLIIHVIYLKWSNDQKVKNDVNPPLLCQFYIRLTEINRNWRDIYGRIYVVFLPRGTGRRIFSFATKNKDMQIINETLEWSI